MSVNGLRLTSVVVLLLLTSCHQNVSGPIQKVCIHETCFTVELAQTQEEQTRGLQNRLSLAQDAAMLFVFSDEGQHPFWMKDTLIPLDMLWIDDQGVIVYIEHKAKPCPESSCPVYLTEMASRYVLEINGDLAQKYHFTVGDRVKFQYAP